MLTPTTFDASRILLLATLLMLACVQDVRTRRIPNALVVVTGVAGLAFAALTRTPLPALATAAAGMLTGLAIWFPFYLLRMLGAGDVKLFAAAAAWLGPKSALVAALYTGIAGGLLSLTLMLSFSGLKLTLLRLASVIHAPATLRGPQSGHTGRLPYALAITAGTLLTIWLSELP